MTEKINSKYEENEDILPLFDKAEVKPLPVHSILFESKLKDEPYKVFIDPNKLNGYLDHLGITNDFRQELKIQNVTEALQLRLAPKERYHHLGDYNSNNKTVRLYTRPAYADFATNINRSKHIAEASHGRVKKHKNIFADFKYESKIRTERMLNYLQKAPPERSLPFTAELYFKKMQQDFNLTLKHELVHAKQDQNEAKYMNSMLEFGWNILEPHFSKIATLSTASAVLATSKFGGLHTTLEATLPIVSGFIVSKLSIPLVKRINFNFYLKHEEEKNARAVSEQHNKDLNYKNIAYIIPKVMLEKKHLDN